MGSAIQSERQLVARAKKLQASGNVTSWELADIYAALREAGWSTRKIADKCQAGVRTVQRFCKCVRHYCRKNERPTFWEAFQDVNKVAANKLRELQAAFRVDQVAGVQIHDGIRHGDFREVLADLPEASVDLVLTDPPYGRDSLELFDGLGELAARVLVDGGSLVTFFGQSLLPEVLTALLKAGLSYRWLLCVDHSHSRAVMKTPKVYVNQKPLLWLSKGPPFQTDIIGDLIQSEKPSKATHDWEQGEVEALYLIERLSPVGGLVVDPMAGSGTNLVAASALGRRWLGAEINETHAKAASARLSKGN